MNVGRFTGLLMMAAWLSPILHAQGSFWDTSEAYLRQTPPSDTPKVFAPRLLADSDMFVMGRVAFSPDGREFYLHPERLLGKWRPSRHQNDSIRKPLMGQAGYPQRALPYTDVFARWQNLVYKTSSSRKRYEKCLAIAKSRR
jgi:hypothetical protein